jgi:RNA-binding protein
MTLTDQQRRHLKGLGHRLRPVVMVGQAGLKDTVLAEIDAALTHHELIKVKIAGNDRELRDRQIEEILAASRADLVDRVGQMAVLFRRNPKRPRVALP